MLFLVKYDIDEIWLDAQRQLRDIERQVEERHAPRVAVGMEVHSAILHLRIPPHTLHPIAGVAPTLLVANAKQVGRSQVLQFYILLPKLLHSHLSAKSLRIGLLSLIFATFSFAMRGMIVRIVRRN